LASCEGDNTVKGSDVQIAVIGPLSLQNQLLVFFIEEKTGVKCCLCENARASFFELDEKDDLQLVLLDCVRLGKTEILEFLRSGLQRELAERNLILFNLGLDAGIENEALMHGVRGFLYEQDCLDNFLKAIDAALRGEVWISRKKLAECLFTECIPSRKSSAAHTSPDLTKREIQILACLAKGDSNQMIGEKLCISTHTVKSHLANIFKKIKVSNRRQAATWAIDNL